MSTDTTATTDTADDATVEPAGRRPLAVVTGASRGLGRALATGLARAGWDLVLDARTADDLVAVADELRRHTRVVMVIGDVAEARHRDALAGAAASHGPVDLLVNNASTLGPSPLPRLADVDPDEFARVLAVNTVAPVAVFAALRDHLAADATVLNITSDAAVEAWEGWGVYGASKAALEQATAVLAVEHPDLAVHAVDPGDLRTDMHQAAFPGEDISDRPLPEQVVPAVLELVARRRPSGRHALTTVEVAA